MKPIDNIKYVLPFLVFEDRNDFYYLQILQRKKENPQLGSNSRVIKNYYINSADYLINHYDEIKGLCTMFNARACIRLNKRNYEKVSYKEMVNIANSMCNKEFSFIKKSYDRAVGNGHSEHSGSSTWILDFDDAISKEDMSLIESIISNSNPMIKGVNKVVAMIPSRAGTHIITQPFDSREFKNQFPSIDIHKDNPTNLYIP